MKSEKNIHLQLIRDNLRISVLGSSRKKLKLSSEVHLHFEFQKIK